MNNVIKQLMERKSMRAYEKQEIPHEDVQAILAAAVQALEKFDENLNFLKDLAQSTLQRVQ